MSSRSELQEIAHTGGKITFNVRVDPDGRLSYQIGYQHSNPTPATVAAVYAIPQGVAVADLDLGGIGTQWAPPPIRGCYPVFIASDNTGMFGHECPRCSGYWRGDHGGDICPYCSLRATGRHQLLSQAQRLYVAHYCDVLSRALESGQAGDHFIDMDAIVDKASCSAKPAFYLAEEIQQNLFTCQACGSRNDVLGTYAYCGRCGTRNDFQELEKTAQRIRDRINSGAGYEACVRDTVATFDSFADQYARQLLARVPMTPARRQRLGSSRFQNLRATAELFLQMFDIDVLKGLSVEDVAVGELRSHRRHVYEHKGGEADEKYIADSGDDVRLKQALRETRESAHRTMTIVKRMCGNLHEGFHEIFPPVADRLRKGQIGRAP